MRIAVTYDNANGEVFQHFGKTEFFKIYETEDDHMIMRMVRFFSTSEKQSFLRFMRQRMTKSCHPRY